MSYRYMRTIIFFDLPTLTKNDLTNYRHFVKYIKSCGFYMLQESVYVKMSIDNQVLDSTINRIKNMLPPKGSVIALNITEKQFSGMNIMLGSNKTDVLTTDERIVFL